MNLLAQVLLPLFFMLIFPGFLFLANFAMLAEWMDRKLHARLQNRVGPPFFQPLADFIKLAAKEELIPKNVDTVMFKLTPMFGLAAVLTSLLYIPIWNTKSLFPFQGDVVVVLYLLTIPTITFFLGGWYSRSMFSMIGAARSLMQLFAYEIPLLLAILAPALLAKTWSLSEMAAYYSDKPYMAAFNAIGLVISIVALLGKLEKVPFDIPEAETEIVAGTFTEYSGRLLAIFRLAVGIEMVVGATLIAAVFLPFGLGRSDLLGATAGNLLGFVLYLLKVLALLAVMSLSRTVFARLRIDQMIAFCWKVAAPVAFVQLLVDLLARRLVG